MAKTYNKIVDADIAQRLLDLNQGFYQSFADPFSATRGRLQSGVLRVLDLIADDANLLDLGCGNGKLAGELVRRGHQGSYLGLDFSEDLLAIARETHSDTRNISFRLVDLSSANWTKTISSKNYDFIFAFATLHHIPSRKLRLQLLRQIYGLLSHDGRFIHSNWQFLNSERLRSRIQPWDLVGLTEKDVDKGDHLLDWRREGRGLRYVHHFSVEELAQLAQEGGFEMVESFLSDGETGDLGLYHVWSKNPSPSTR